MSVKPPARALWNHTPRVREPQTGTLASSRCYWGCRVCLSKTQQAKPWAATEQAGTRPSQDEATTLVWLAAAGEGRAENLQGFCGPGDTAHSEDIYIPQGGKHFKSGLVCSTPTGRGHGLLSGSDPTHTSLPRRYASFLGLR